MSRRKGPRSEDWLRTPEKVDERVFQVKSERLEPPSSVVWYFTCPFCTSEVKAYLWSLSGGGKRCECGAYFNRMGQARHWKGATSHAG